MKYVEVRAMGMKKAQRKVGRHKSPRAGVRPCRHRGTGLKLVLSIEISIAQSGFLVKKQQGKRLFVTVFFFCASCTSGWISRLEIMQRAFLRFYYYINKYISLHVCAPFLCGSRADESLSPMRTAPWRGHLSAEPVCKQTNSTEGPLGRMVSSTARACWLDLIVCPCHAAAS